MPNEVHCAHILVKTQPEALDVLARLQKGESFSKIAGEKSICPSCKKGGDLGTFGRGRMIREFEAAAFSLDKGAITPQPVKTQFGWHVIKRLE
jgi:parvulin-like peptidyl-prolyl isomerase